MRPTRPTLIACVVALVALTAASSVSVEAAVIPCPPNNICCEGPSRAPYCVCIGGIDAGCLPNVHTCSDWGTALSPCSPYTPAVGAPSHPFARLAQATQQPLAAVGDQGSCIASCDATYVACENACGAPCPSGVGWAPCWAQCSAQCQPPRVACRQECRNIYPNARASYTSDDCPTECAASFAQCDQDCSNNDPTCLKACGQMEQDCMKSCNGGAGAKRRRASVRAPVPAAHVRDDDPQACTRGCIDAHTQCGWSCGQDNFPCLNACDATMHQCQAQCTSSAVASKFVKDISNPCLTYCNNWSNTCNDSCDPWCESTCHGEPTCLLSCVGGCQSNCLSVLQNQCLAKCGY